MTFVLPSKSGSSKKWEKITNPIFGPNSPYKVNGSVRVIYVIYLHTDINVHRIPTKSRFHMLILVYPIPLGFVIKKAREKEKFYFSIECHGSVKNFETN